MLPLLTLRSAVIAFAFLTIIGGLAALSHANSFAIGAGLPFAIGAAGGLAGGTAARRSLALGIYGALPLACGLALLAVAPGETALPASAFAIGAILSFLFATLEPAAVEIKAA